MSQEDKGIDKDQPGRVVDDPDALALGQNGTPDQNAAEDQKKTGSVQADVNVDEAVTGQDDVLALQEALDVAQKKADDYWDQLLRARADLTNQQRRAERELENAHKFALDRFVRELLPVHDSLALGHDAAIAADANLAKLVEGSALTLELFDRVLEKFSVKLINPEGQPFNPDHHQAMSMQPAPPDIPPNTVLTVFQKGCLLNDRLIRPAMVIVSDRGDAKKGQTPKIDQMA